jgi:hypothetical protein
MILARYALSREGPKNDSAHPWFFTDPVAQNQKFFLRRKSLGWVVVSA